MRKLVIKHGMNTKHLEIKKDEHIKKFFQEEYSKLIQGEYGEFVEMKFTCSMEKEYFYIQYFDKETRHQSTISGKIIDK